MLFSCKKEIENRSKTSDPNKSVARLIDGTEAEDILTDLEEFYTYTEEVATNPGVLPSVLPNEITPERANAMVENVFNYYFARLNQTLTNDVTIEISKTFSVNGDGNISTLALAEAFNEMRAELRTFYENQKNLNETVEFILADAEYKDMGDDIEITLIGVMGQDPFEPETSEMRAFGSDDKWSVLEKGGRFDGVGNGIWGSPELIGIAVNRDKTSNSKFFVTNVVNKGGYQYAGNNPILHASNFGAPDNPMYLLSSTVWRNHIIHYYKAYDPNSPHFHGEEPWIIPSAMTYYRTWINVLVTNECSNWNKYFVRIRLYRDIIPIIGPHPVVHVMRDFYVGDRLRVLPTDPYMQVPNGVAISL